jgi:hypothetical protein
MQMGNSECGDTDASREAVGDDGNVICFNGCRVSHRVAKSCNSLRSCIPGDWSYQFQDMEMY